MIRWILCVLLFLGGVACVFMGLYIELEVQYEVGNWTGAANLFYGGEIEYYREQVLMYLTAGPILFVLAYFLRPRVSQDDRKTKLDSQS